MSSSVQSALYLLAKTIQMPLKSNIVLLPILLFFSVPLLILSCITASLSIAILLLRVMTVYSGIAAGVVKDFLLRKIDPAPAPNTRRSVVHYRRRSSAAADEELLSTETTSTYLVDHISANGHLEMARGRKLGQSGDKVLLPTDVPLPESGFSSPVQQHRRTRSALFPIDAPRTISPTQLSKVRSDGAMGEYFDFEMPSTYSRQLPEEANTGKVRSRHRRTSSSSSTSGLTMGGRSLNITSIND